MTLNDLIAAFRVDADDNAAPYLWSDDDLTRYANDAVMEAARRARLLADSRTAEVCQAAIVAGDPYVALDPRVIFVRRAIVSGQSMPLNKTQERILDECIPSWESAASSIPSHYIHQRGEIRLYPPSSVDGTLQMTVIREPLIAMADLGDEPEIPARHHESLIQWMLYRAFSKQDSDAGANDRAALALAAFEADFGRRSSAIEEEWQRQHYGIDGYEGVF